MKKHIQLSILIVLPLLIFAFLMIFGKNHYKITIYYPQDSVKLEGKWKVTKYHTLPNYIFINQYGEKITNKHLKGKIKVVNFFFTRCGNPTLCPKMSKEFTRLQENLMKTNNVVLLSHTVDPIYDTPEVLKKYGESYNAKKTAGTC